MQSKPSVTVAVPTLNEAANIETLVRRFLATRYPNLVEVFVADGGSTDGTRAIVARLAQQDARVRLLDNPDRIQSVGMKGELRAMWISIAFDSARNFPLRNCSTGTLPLGFISRKSAVRVSARSTSVSTQRYSCPVCFSIQATFQQLPERWSP